MARTLQTHLSGAIDYTSATFLELLSSAMGIRSGEGEGLKEKNMETLPFGYFTSDSNRSS